MLELVNFFEAVRAKKINAMRERVKNGTASYEDLTHYYQNRP